MVSKWDHRFIALAREISGWSKDPSTKCGAVIVRPDRTIASLGYNGFPRGTRDDPELYNDRAEKYQRVIHAELNAIISAREPLQGYTLYTWPGALAPTCDRCAPHVIQSGIARIVHYRIDNDFSRRHNPERSLQMYAEAGVEVVGLEEPDPWRMISLRALAENHPADWKYLASHRSKAHICDNAANEDTGDNDNRERWRRRQARIVRSGDSPDLGRSQGAEETLAERQAGWLPAQIAARLGLTPARFARLCGRSKQEGDS